VATELIADVLAGGSYRKHMAELRQRLAQARDHTAARLGKLGIMPWIMPRGGFYLWCRLPDGLDSADIARHCLEAGVVLAPGNVFSVSQSAAPFMRFNVAQSDDQRVEDALIQALDQSAQRE
jgi:DNA-binding transcriptional MocR family regulator